MIAQHLLLDEVAALVDDGVVRTTLHGVLGRIDAKTLKEAHALIESGRSIGKVVPITKTDTDGMTATIEYAVEVLKVPHIILCGHSDCGALKAAVNGDALDTLPKARRWLRHVEAAFQHKQPLNPADGDGAELASLIRGNVVAQLANLKVQPAVISAMAQGTLCVHGWYYDILSGRIERYDEKLRRFVPLLSD